MVNWHPLKPFGTLWKVQVCIVYFLDPEVVFLNCYPLPSPRLRGEGKKVFRRVAFGQAEGPRGADGQRRLVLIHMPRTKWEKDDDPKKRGAETAGGT